MTLEERTNHFKERGMKLHNNKFDYSLINYINAKTEIKIICPIHGQFQQIPDKHLSPKSKGCQKCWKELKIKLEKERDYSKIKKKECLPKEKFLERANKKFNNKFKYNLNNYIGITKCIIEIVCPIHGIHLNNPRNHITSNTGCPKCGVIQKVKNNTNSYKEMINQLQLKHNFKYDYPEYNKNNYKNKRSKIEIICKKHGKFIKSSQKHLSGQGCFQCKIEELIEKNILVGGYSEELFNQKSELKNVPAILYFLEINNGEFYKIGISKTSIEQRIKGIKSKAKQFNKNISINIIKTFNKTLYECFLIEQKILNDNKNYRIYTKWSTELFNKNIIDKIYNYFVNS